MFEVIFQFLRIILCQELFHKQLFARPEKAMGQIFHLSRSMGNMELCLVLAQNF